MRTIEDVKAIFKPYIEDYLELKKIPRAKNGLYRCINPDHSDTNASLHVTPDKVNLYCFGCGKVFDIFSACKILDDKPTHGPEFFTDTLKYLCELFEEPYEEILDESQLARLEVYSAYEVAHQIITTSIFSERVKQEIARRGWEEEKVREWGIGSVSTFDEFWHEMMGSNGYTPEFLKKADLSRSDLFSQNCLIFTIKDEYGTPIGFASKNLDFVKGGGASKYVNQTSSGEINIYEKRKRLYGINIARKAPGPLYIVEGYPDAITAWHHGMENVVCVGGTAFTESHVSELRRLKINDIVLCFDGDFEGQEKVEDVLKKFFSGLTDMRVRIVKIPFDMDPDDYIRERGIDSFKALEPWTAFEWQLSRLDDQLDGREVCQTMIPFILNEGSLILQEPLAKKLSLMSGVDVSFILAELQRLQSEKGREVRFRQNDVIENTFREARRNPEQAPLILTRAIKELHEVEGSRALEAYDSLSFVDTVNDQKASEEDPDKEWGFKLDRLKNIEEAIDGECRKDVWLVIGGKENSGKSSLAAQICYEIAKMEVDNNAVCIYHTIDDSLQQLLPKFICIAAADVLDMGPQEYPSINQIKHPFFDDKSTEKRIRSIREAGYKKLVDMANSGRFIVKDATNGNSLEYSRDLIKYWQGKYPDRQVVYFLDNFHNLGDFRDVSNKDERVRFKTMADVVKGLAVELHIPIFSTMEYTKLGPGIRPSNNNISETVAIQYRTNFISHLYNDMHESGQYATCYHIGNDSYGRPAKLPRLEFIVGKNKISDYKKTTYLDFFPASSICLSVSADEVEAENQKRVEEAKAKREKRQFSSSQSSFDMIDKGCGVEDKEREEENEEE